MTRKEFYQFFLKHEEQPDNVLADMIATKFAGVNYIQALDIIQATRHTKKVNFIERGSKNEDL